MNAPLQAMLARCSRLPNDLEPYLTLAWIWVEEKKTRNREGNQLREERVGLGKKYREIRRTFSDEFRGYLNDNTVCVPKTSSGLLT
jgi:hypothetical protein